MDDRAGLQLIQIHAAGDALTALVAAIPLGGAGACQVLACLLIAEIDFPDQGSPDVVDRQAHVGGGVELVGDIGVWVEGIGVVG